MKKLLFSWSGTGRSAKLLFGNKPFNPKICDEEFEAFKDEQITEEEADMIRDGHIKKLKQLFFYRNSDN